MTRQGDRAVVRLSRVAVRGQQAILEGVGWLGGALAGWGGSRRKQADESVSRTF
jgi:hypothetical protein